MYLSIIIPAYNEEQSLRASTIKFNQYLSRQNYDYEIIIVNDGSTDNTAEVAKELSEKIPQIKFIDNKINRGKGAAVKQGFLSACGDYRLFIDADGATSIEHVDKIWPEFKKGADIVIGSRNYRDADGAYQKVKQAAWKRYLGIAGNFLIQLLTVRGIWDTQCGFKAMKAQAAEKIVPQLTIPRFAFDVEFLILARKYGFEIAKIPVVWENSPFSRVGIKGYFVSLKEVFKIRWNILRGKYKK